MSLPLETPQPPRRSTRKKSARRPRRSRHARPPFSDRAAMAVAAVLRLGRLLVRRELRWADVRIAGRALVGRAMVVPRKAAAAGSVQSVQTDFAPTRVVPRSAEEPESEWLPAARAAQAIEVSEEPMHTLPAELQDIFANKPARHATAASRAAARARPEPAETVPGV